MISLLTDINFDEVTWEEIIDAIIEKEDIIVIEVNKCRCHYRERRYDNNGGQ